MDAFNHIQKSSIRTHRVAAQVHGELTAQLFAKSLKEHWRHRIIQLDGQLAIRFRAIVKLKGKNDWVLKFAYITDHAEVQDLEFVLYTAFDADMGSWFARKVRLASKEHEYKYTARDEQLLIGFDPATAADDISAKFADHNDAFSVLARQLYKVGLRHLESNRETDPDIEELKPFDYAQEMLRALKNNGRIQIDDAFVTVNTVASLPSSEDDVMLKFKLEGDGLLKDTELCFYLTMDSLFNSVAVRKIRIRNKKFNDYSDSDEDHALTLDHDPKQAAHELIEQIKNDMFGEVIHDMIMRARNYMAGGDAMSTPNYDGEHDDEEQDRDSHGGNINWKELGFEDPGF